MKELEYLMQTMSAGLFVTDAGMLGMWNKDSFQHIADYDTWESELCDDADIIRHITTGDFVPVYIHTDGCFRFEVRLVDIHNQAHLTQREEKYVRNVSEPYLFVTNGQVYMSGIEHIKLNPASFVEHWSMLSGKYAVTVYLIDWFAEEGSADEAERPTVNALPDFLLVMSLLQDQPRCFERKLKHSIGQTASSQDNRIYTPAQWLHSYPNEAIHPYYELGEQRYENRHEFDSTWLSLEPHPKLEEIANNPEFKIQVICSDEFNKVWQRAVDDRIL